MLRTLKREVGGRAYDLLGNALDRLQSTTVKTNIRAGDAVETTFSWIDSYSQLKDRTGTVRGKRITLAKWFYDGDRKSVVSGKRVSERVDIGGRRIINKQTI